MNPVSAYLNSRESTTLGKQRVIFFFVTAVFSVLLTVATFFYQTKDTAALVTDSINIVLCVLFVFLYFYRALTIREASNMLYIMLQLDLCAHKIHLCLSGEEDISALLIQDSFLSLLSAIDFAKEHFGVEMERPEIVCKYSSRNNQCIGERCPFSPTVR